MTVKMVLVGATLVAASIALGAGGASAEPHATPNGLVGAWNMMMDSTMAPGTGGAMDHANHHGNHGMFRAVCVSSGDFCS